MISLVLNRITYDYKDYFMKSQESHMKCRQHGMKTQ
jgi:hypothetical protein